MTNTLWIRFPSGNCGPTPIVYDEKWQKTYPTFEAFKENFIRGWGCKSADDYVGELVEYAVQDTQPGPDTIWQRAPEFVEAAA